MGDDVLVEAQLAPGPDDAPQLVERGGLVRDGAEHERCHPGVEPVVVSRERVGDAGDDGHPHGRLGRRLLGAIAEVGLGLEGDDLGDRRGVVAEVQTVAGADLDDAAAEIREQLVAVLGGACVLRARAQQQRPHAGEERVADVGRTCHAKDDRMGGPGAYRHALIETRLGRWLRGLSGREDRPTRQCPRAGRRRRRRR